MSKNEVIKVSDFNAVISKAVDNNFDIDKLAKIGKVAFRDLINKEIKEKEKQQEVIKKEIVKAQKDLKDAAVKIVDDQHKKAFEDACKLLIKAGFNVTHTCDIDVSYKLLGGRSRCTITAAFTITFGGSSGFYKESATTRKEIEAPKEIDKLFKETDKLEVDLHSVRQEIAQLHVAKSTRVDEFTEQLEAAMYSKHLTSVKDGAEVMDFIKDIVTTYMKSEKLVSQKYLK